MLPSYTGGLRLFRGSIRTAPASPAATPGDREATSGAWSAVTGPLSESRRRDKLVLWVLGAGAGQRDRTAGTAHRGW